MKNHSFLFAYLLIMAALIGLSYEILNLMEDYPVLSSIFYIQFINGFGCFVLLGMGIGLPLAILGSVLGWVQLALLMSGNIDPHLAKEGLVTVLKTILAKF
jgi:hypothetical protein